MDVDKLQCEDTTRLVLFVPRDTLIRQLSYDSFVNPNDDVNGNASPVVSLSELPDPDPDTVQREGGGETCYVAQEGDGLTVVV